MTRFRFGRRREKGFGQFGRFRQAGGQFDAADGLGLFVFFPTAAGQIAADDAFNGQRLGFFDDHRTAREFVRERLQVLRQRIAGFGDEVIRRE